MDMEELRRIAEWALRVNYKNNAMTHFHAAASPATIIALLDEIAAKDAEIERLRGECDFFSARSEEERVNRGLAEKDFHDAMEIVRAYEAKMKEVE